jgi:hypothetical protein
MDEYRTEFNQTQSSIVNLVSNPLRRIFECNQLQSLVNQSVNKTFFFNNSIATTSEVEP